MNCCYKSYNRKDFFFKCFSSQIIPVSHRARQSILFSNLISSAIIDIRSIINSKRRATDRNMENTSNSNAENLTDCNADPKTSTVGNKHPVKVVIRQITDIFLPIINYLTAASILKSFVILFASFGILNTDGGIYRIFYAVSDGFFYFLPFFLALTASKVWKTDRVIALFIPVAMLYPDIISALENGSGMSFFFLKIQPAVYHSGVIPVLLSVGLLHFVEIPCDRFLPEAIRGFLKPILCMLIVLPVTFLLFGPIGTWIGNALTAIFDKLYQLSPTIAGGFMGFVIQPLVVAGAHWSLVPVSISAISAKGFDVIMPLLGGAVYGQCGASLAMGILLKEKKQKRIAFQAAFSCALGVSEPALFGVTVPNPKAMFCACIGGAVGGAIAGAAGAHCYSFAFPSIVTSVAYYGPGFALFLCSMATGLILSFLLTLLLMKNSVNKTPVPD